jgi:hypothetical protein
LENFLSLVLFEFFLHKRPGSKNEMATNLDFFKSLDLISKFATFYKSFTNMPNLAVQKLKTTGSE